MTTKLRAAASSSGTILDPSVGDGVLELWTGNNPASQVLAASFAADGTPTFLKDTSIGYGQTWQNVTGSRGFGGTYTNNTGRPIYVHVTGNAGVVNAYFSLRIGGVLMAYSSQAFAASYLASQIIVPAGATYSAVSEFGMSGLVLWTELR
jgi:hypothetical protein